MRFNSPIPRTGLPHYSEASPQRSIRDADVTARQWLKNKDVGKQLAWLSNSVQQIQRYLERARLFKPTGDDGIQLFVGTIFQVYPDYLLCYPYTEFSDTTGTDHIIVAKQYEHRCSDLYAGNFGNADPKTIMGVDHTYTFADNIDSNGINNVTRTDTYSSTTETQIIVPPWVFGDIIYAISCPTIIVDDASSPKKYSTLVHACESRQWAGPTS